MRSRPRGKSFKRFWATLRRFTSTSRAVGDPPKRRALPRILADGTIRCSRQRGRLRMKVLVIDVGGTHVKVLVTGRRVERKIDSGSSMTARKMVKQVKKITQDWRYDAVSIGYPGPMLHGRPVAEPHNLGGGWIHFDFCKAFGKPVKMINDAAMQALGSYRGGRML